MRPHTRTHCAKKGDCEEHAQAGPGGVSADTRCVARRGEMQLMPRAVLSKNKHLQETCQEAVAVVVRSPWWSCLPRS